MRTGLAFLPLTVAIIVGSTQISAPLLQRVPPRALMVPGMVLMGLGMGLTFMPVFATATAGVAPRDSGVASATVNRW